MEEYGRIAMFIVFFGSIVIGVPIPIGSLIATAVGLFFLDIPFGMLAQTAYQAFEPFPLLTIPLFILAGNLMLRSGMAERIIKIADVLVGSSKGGLGQVSVLASGFFASLSGSGSATSAAIGSITIPAMQERNYSSRFAGGVVATSGALGTMIPPSNMLVMYALVAGESIPRLFLGGVLPGIVLIAMLMMVVRIYAQRCNFGGTGTFSWKLLGHVFWDGKWAAFTPILILGGIYMGVFTPTEAAAVAVFYTLFVGIFIYKELKIADLRQALRHTALFGGILLIIAPTAALGQLLALYEIPDLIYQTINQFTDSQAGVLFFCAAIFLVAGMFADSLVQVVILAPVLLPVVTKFGVDPVFFGVFIALTCEIGFFTPPVGGNLFIASRISGAPVEDISIGVIPFLCTFMVMLLIFCFFPTDWVTWLPNLIYGVQG
jgi:C4-dicarboxylate transporter DctM subunit